MRLVNTQNTLVLRCIFYGVRYEDAGGRGCGAETAAVVVAVIVADIVVSRQPCYVLEDEVAHG